MYRKRLKNVYDLLEAGNNRKVIQEVDKLIVTSSANLANKNKKQIVSENEKGLAGYDEHTTLIIAKALKCLALVRTGKKSESDTIIDELLNSNTTDENALSIIMQYCKETHQLSKIVTFYENAVNKCQKTPNMIGTNEYEEILTSLFYAYVRNRDFNKQQQTALKLYKQTNKMMFCFWNAASYVMMSRPDLNLEHISAQSSNADLKEKQKNEMYLQLGEKILQKAYEDRKMEYNGEFLLYLNILEERNKYEEALKIVEQFDEKENLSKIGQIDFKIKKKLVYFRHLKRWMDLLNLSKEYISHESMANIDDWLTYQCLIDSLIELVKENTQNNDELIRNALSYLNDLKNKIETSGSTSSSKFQGPYMARIELINKLFQLNEQISTCLTNNQINENLVKEYLNDFIRPFSLKPGFYYELIYFRDIINKFNLVDYVLSILKELHDQNRPFKNIKSIYTCLSYWQLHSYFGKQDEMNENDLINLSNQFESMYTEALEYGKDLLSTGFQYADEFIIMSVHLRYNLFKKLNNQKYNILELICTLKQALINSPSNYQLKLLLLNLYSHIGAYEPLKKMYDSMEIKNIQHYSTSNLLMIHNLRLGSLQSSIATYTTMDQFFTSNLFDMVNFLVNCYKFGTFLKSIEICSFLKTIRQSLSMNLCLINYMSLGFIIQSTHLSQLDQASNSSEEDMILNDFKSLKSKLDKHSKELADSSIVFDPVNNLLPSDNSQLKSLLMDHNDKDVLYHWDTHEEQQIGNKQYELIVDEQRRLLSLRNLFIRFVDSSLTNWLGLNSTENEAPKLEPVKKNLLEFDYEFNYELDSNSLSHKDDQMKDNLAEESLDSKLKIYITKSFYLKRFTQLNLNNLINTIVGLTCDLCQNDLPAYLAQEQQNNQLNLIQYREKFKTACETLKNKFTTIIKLMNDENSFKIDGLNRILECFTSCLEAISFIIIIFTSSLMHKELKPIWSEKMKKSKKKKGLYVQYGASIDVVFEIYEQLCHLVSYLNTQLKYVCDCVLNLTEQYINKSISVASNIQYLNDIPQSYLKSFEDVRKVFNSKLNHLLKFTGNPNIISLENLKI